MRPPTTREMSDAHEERIAEVLGVRQTRGSGNQFNDPTDGRTPHDGGAFEWAADGKSTLGKSIGVSRAMWAKLVEQAHGARPAVPLCFYDDQRLTVGLDLVVVRLYDLGELLETARAVDAARVLLRRVRDGEVQYPDRYGDVGTRELAADLLDVLDGKSATRGDGLDG